jgi:hypothetical protein
MSMCKCNKSHKLPDNVVCNDCQKAFDKLKFKLELNQAYREKMQKQENNP